VYLFKEVAMTDIAALQMLPEIRSENPGVICDATQRRGLPTDNCDTFVCEDDTFHCTFNC
jgi:hypothetical protein